MRPFRVYTDTSVIGGCEDPQFADYSRRFFAAVREGHVVVLVSEVVVRELEDAPLAVRRVLTDLPFHAVERITVTREILDLRDQYISAGIVGPRWGDDAAHVAAATVARADAIASWNFRHIVRLDKIKAYNQINLLAGYGVLTIISPTEVDFGDQE